MTDAINLENTAQEYTTLLKAGVLFLVFNRPETTARVFQAIRKAQPPRLYVAADGPRTARKDESQLCEETRLIATNVDWPCEVKTLFRDENLGCRVAVSSAIDWFFENEPEGIILEDDCLPDPSFFRYAQELLARYRDDQRVMVISGDHFHGDAHQPEHSYFFSRYNHCWGWASWRRAWDFYDHEMKLWPEQGDSGWLTRFSNGDRFFEKYWESIFDRCHTNEIDSWAYRWTFSCWLRDGLTILPARNLVKNIGFGDDATHTRTAQADDSSPKLERLEFPMIHPTEITRDSAADKWTDIHHFRIRKTVILGMIARRFPGLANAIKGLRSASIVITRRNLI